MSLKDKTIKYLMTITDFKEKRGGVVVGLKPGYKSETIYIADDDIHTICIGATRCGKSRTVVMQSIGLLGLCGESMVVSDPKGELFLYTSEFLKREGYKVYTLDFKNPLKSSKYNFLQGIINAVNSGDLTLAMNKAWDITQTIVGESKGERIWNDGEKSVLCAAILSVVYDNKKRPEFQNLTNVYYFIANMCKSSGSEIPLEKYLRTLPDEHPAKGLISIAEVAPSRTRGSFYTAALTTLRLFTDINIYNLTNKSEFALEDISKGKSALFIILPDEKATFYPLASLFVSQLYENLVYIADKRGGRLENRVNFILDEFGNFTAISDFSSKLTVGGGRGIRFTLFLQAFSQLEEKYGKTTTSTILANCENWIYLRTGDNETRDAISKRLGTYTISTNSHSRSFNGNGSNGSSSYNLTSRALLTSDEVGRIDRPYSLLLNKKDPAIIYSPDISLSFFNKMFGLGNEEHNRKVMYERENKRKINNINENIELWGIWNEFMQSSETSLYPKKQVFPTLYENERIDYDGKQDNKTNFNYFDNFKVFDD